ncbi:MAG: hypothetical protein AB8G05_05415 [Oligoflexales bacterium]
MEKIKLLMMFLFLTPAMSASSFPLKTLFTPLFIASKIQSKDIDIRSGTIGILQNKEFQNLMNAEDRVKAKEHLDRMGKIEKNRKARSKYAAASTVAFGTILLNGISTADPNMDYIAKSVIGLFGTTISGITTKYNLRPINNNNPYLGIINPEGELEILSRRESDQFYKEGYLAKLKEDGPFELRAYN